MRRLAAPFLLFLLCVGFYWKLTLSNDYTFLDSPDLANLDLPRLQFQSATWRQSHIPLWDPYQWLGQPFLGQITGLAYPANWTLPWFPVDDTGKLTLKSVHWYLVLLHFQAALFAYFLCRDWKRSHAASIIGGLVFALGGFLGTTDWPQILNGVLWLPLIVLFLVRALRGRRPVASAALSGAFLGLAWLSGHHEVPIYASTVIAAVWLTALARGPRRIDIVKLAATAAVATGLISTLQILPAQEYAPNVKRWVGIENPIAWNEPVPYSVHQHFTWKPAEILGIVTARPPVHVNPFIGIVAFSLALLGAYHGWRRLPQVRILVAIALAGIFLSLAATNVFHGLLYAALPIFGKARVPARALALFSFAVAPLVAYGFDALQRRSSPWLRRTIYTLIAITAILYLAAAIGLRPAEAQMFTALTAALGAILFAAARARAIPQAALAIPLTLLILVEIGSVSGAELANRTLPTRAGYIDNLYRHTDLVNYLKNQPQPIRVEVSDSDIPYNFGDWHGIPVLGGFAASVSTNVLKLEKHKPRVQDLLGINYYIGKAPPRPDLVLLTDTSSGLNIYRNPAALPRTWTVHAAAQVKDADAINARLDAPEFQPRQEALFLETPPTLEACPGNDEVALSGSTNPNRIHINVKLNCRALVVLSDTFFPGWRARVDGKETAILAPYGALRGVVVEKGAHHIEFAYLPTSAVAGAALTASGVLFVFWTLWFSRKRKTS
jgi:hypothetical protein